MYSHPALFFVDVRDPGDRDELQVTQARREQYNNITRTL
jgi:hypothetical protein